MISNANGVTYPVIAVKTVIVSSSLSLLDTLLIPLISNKLLVLSQIIVDLNCVALIYLTFCLFHDIFTKRIIGRGTRRGGLIGIKVHHHGVYLLILGDAMIHAMLKLSSMILSNSVAINEDLMDFPNWIVCVKV